MASAKKDFEGFVRWLHLPQNAVNSNVSRLANLVLENFESILSSSRQGSRRSILLAEMARRDLLQTSDTLPDIASVAPEGQWLWRRLRHLTVGPFRGFRSAESFNIQQRIVLFYGPNGSGKTSLCEAFEYSLLGSVEEADTNRISQATYLSNIHENRFDPPILKATDYQGNEIDVEPNADNYRFCFVEKNRIDAFSRIAARPTTQRAELIATLFGMDKFNDFVSHFNETMDNQLTLVSTNQTLLSRMREALAEDHSTVEGETSGLEALSAEELSLAHEYAEGMTYENLKGLIGSPEAPAQLQKLNEMLNVVPPSIINITRQGLTSFYEEVNAAYASLEKINAELAARASQISFKDLYSAVLDLQSTEGSHCPACDTPLAGPNHVLNNPYEKAEIGLKQLAELVEIQATHKKNLEDVAQTSRTLKEQLKVIYQFVIANTEVDTLAGKYLSSLPEDFVENWCEKFYEASTHPEQESLTLENILEIVQKIETQDIASRLCIDERQKNITERDRLIKYQLLMQAQDNKRLLFVEKIIASRQRIAEFDITNSQLIISAGEERLEISRDLPIKVAYDQFLTLLRSYRSELPGTLMSGLNDQAMQLYNEFNNGDLDSDKLAALHLPLTGEQKIEICFRGQPQERVDALKILSEGHIRCLGLAILLAKNMSLETPLIVFDDAINAIDHDHRRGIRETIFESNYFENTQIIVTCHSHEFIKDIQQSLNPRTRQDSKVYLIRNHNGNYQPRVYGNMASRNYVEMARAAREELNDRGALDASRKAIEMLAEKVWRWLGSYEHGTISVLLAGAGAEPSLRNLCEALRKKLSDTNNFDHHNKPIIITALERVLGIPKENLVWVYLNKGTHEESNRDDFDSDKVEQVVTTIEELDELHLRPHR